MSVPGVGDYDLNYSTKERLEVEFGKAKRKEIFDVDEDIPGPKYMPLVVDSSSKIGFTK